MRMTVGLLLRIVFVLGIMAVIQRGVEAYGGPPYVTLVAWLAVFVLMFAPRGPSVVPLMDDDRIDCPACGGHGFLLGADDTEIACEQCDGSGKVPVEMAETPERWGW